MNVLAKKLVLLAAVPAIFTAFAACSEEGQDIGAGQCPVLPLFTWEYDASSKEWAMVGKDGKPVDTTNIRQAEQGPSVGNGRCITPPGNALTVGSGGGGAGGSGTGGKTNAGGKDAGRD